MKIAFFPGAFNPIHKTHLDIVKRAKEQYGFDKIVFVLRNNHLHKANNDLPSLEDAYNMVNMAIEPYKYMDCLALEFKGDKIIDFPHVAKILKKLYKQKVINVIMGDESFLHGFNNWEKPNTVYNDMRFYINPRYNHINLIQKKPLLEKRNTFLSKLKNRLELLTLELSSSHLRNGSIPKEKLKQYLPNEVLQYAKIDEIYKIHQNENKFLSYLRNDTYMTPSDNEPVPAFTSPNMLKKAMEKNPSLSKILVKRGF